MKARIAVIHFPGNNCEQETKLACETAGMDADVILWNNADSIKDYDGYILQGGWSYEDRVRAGVISAKDPVMKIVKGEADKGKPVLGICNGAQALVEGAMVPGITEEIDMALAPNYNPKVSGYYCAWINLRVNKKKDTAFTRKYEDGEIIRIPIAHGEGRFTTNDQDVLKQIVDNNQIVFQYCDEDGNLVEEFPVNPNGAVFNAAAICNKEGNVMSTMPHPERANFKRQVPGHKGDNKELNEPGPGRKIFESMKEYIEENCEKWKK